MLEPIIIQSSFDTSEYAELVRNMAERNSGKYSPYREAMEKLLPGQYFIINIPSGQNIDKIRSRITGTVSNVKKSNPTFIIKTHILKDQNIIIVRRDFNRDSPFNSEM